jgi:flavin reductase (DIM6/NTAB) family NADH-FMN oxidoreductase RutF
VLVAGIAPNHHTAQCIEAAGGLTAHLLRSEQTELALKFAAASGHDQDKLAGLQLLPPPLPVAGPRLADCLAWGAGPVFATLKTGDRNFYWVDLRQGESVTAGQPLRQRQLLAAADPPTRLLLKADRERDIQLQQPWRQAWRAELPADGRIR